MGGVGLAARDRFTAPVVEFPYQLGVLVESLGCGQVRGAMVLPQPSRATKCGDAAFGRDTGPGDNSD